MEMFFSLNAMLVLGTNVLRQTFLLPNFSSIIGHMMHGRAIWIPVADATTENENYHENYSEVVTKCKYIKWLLQKKADLN